MAMRVTQMIMSLKNLSRLSMPRICHSEKAEMYRFGDILFGIITS